MTPKEEREWWLSVYRPSVSKYLDYPFKLHGFDTAIEMRRYLTGAAPTQLKALQGKASPELQVVRDWVIETRHPPKTVRLSSVEREYQCGLIKGQYLANMEVVLTGLVSPERIVGLIQFFTSLKTKKRMSVWESHTNAEAKRITQYMAAFYSQGPNSYHEKAEREIAAITSIERWLNESYNPWKPVLGR